MTDLFNENLNSSFNSIIGAYTQMTSPEIDKVTFNVKAKLRNLLIDRSIDIPSQHDTNNTITFKVIPFNTIDNPTIFTSKEIVCKYSKPNKNEVSIYFRSTEFPYELSPSNYWFIFFRENDVFPWLGFCDKKTFETLIFKSLSPSPVNPSFKLKNIELTQTEPPTSRIKFSNPSLKNNSTSKNHITKSIDRLEVAKKTDSIGIKGEELILYLEKDKLIKKGYPELANNVEWSSKNVGDGLGYDILSYEIISGVPQKIYIEVKTTEKSINTPFFISYNELSFSINNSKNYYLYRVYDLNTTNPKFFILKGSLEQLNLKPYTYQVIL